MPNIFPNGAGEALGDIYVTCKPLYISASMRFIHADTGDDGGGNTGTDKEHPLASLAAAVAASSDNDVLVMLSGHEETIAAPLALLQGMTVVGAGLSGGLPTVKLTNNQAAGSMFTVAADGVRIGNIWFEEEAQSNSATAQIVVSGAGFQMVGCYWELNNFTTAAGLRFNAGGNHARIQSTTFVSTATSAATRPVSALAVAGAITDLDLSGLVVSSGANGFSGNALAATAAVVTRLRAPSVSMLLGANAAFHASTVFSGFNPQVTTGGAQVSW